MQNVTEMVKTGKDAEGNDVNSAAINPLRAYFSQYTDFTAYLLVGPNKRGEMVERVYVQEPLSVFLKQEFGEVITEFFQDVVKGENGIDLSQIWQENSGRPAIAVPTNPEEVETLIKDEGTLELLTGILELLRQLPTFQIKLILIALGVPEGERDWAEQIIVGPVSRGGLSDDDFENIVISFLKQNAKAIRAFFTDRRERIATVFREEVLLQEKTVEGTGTEKLPEPDSTGTTPSSTTPAPSASTQEL